MLKSKKVESYCIFDSLFEVCELFPIFQMQIVEFGVDLDEINKANLVKRSIYKRGLNHLISLDSIHFSVVFVKFQHSCCLRLKFFMILLFYYSLILSRPIWNDHFLNLIKICTFQINI